MENKTEEIIQKYEIIKQDKIINTIYNNSNLVANVSYINYYKCILSLIICFVIVFIFIKLLN
jgi:hypothetical protein